MQRQKLPFLALLQGTATHLWHSSIEKRLHVMANVWISILAHHTHCQHFFFPRRMC